MNKLSIQKKPFAYTLTVCLLIFCPLAEAIGQNDSPGMPFSRIFLPGVHGRIDHLAVSADEKKLYIAALGNNTLEVVDLEKGRTDTSLAELQQPQSVICSSETDRILTSNGGDGKCTIFHCNGFKQIACIDVGDDADNIRYDSASHIAYVGYGNGGLALLDLNYSRQEGSIPLSAHPEAFELDQARKLIYVNVPQSDAIEVVDMKKKAVIASWKIPGAKGNFPMAFDPGKQRLFIATRYPSKCFVFDVNTGKPIASWSCSKDADDIFYDKTTRDLYIICGEGFIDDFKEDTTSGDFSLSQRIATRKGTKTALYNPSDHTLYIALPQTEKQEAELRIYKF